ncbi:bicaudal-D-related protein 2-like isoform X2 [Amia ocellicauda]|uniref:bicaudal-D-related protein 2-like isoform X2 n=1 Tax=Amia ocellicauda TaxID=2972642 RepID=UPI003464D952
MSDSVLSTAVNESQRWPSRETRRPVGKGFLPLKRSVSSLADGSLPDLVTDTDLGRRSSVPLTAVAVERALTAELQAVKETLREKSDVGGRDEEVLQSLREQVASLSEQKLVLERRVEAVFQENSALQDSLVSLRKRAARLEQESQEQGLQLQDSWHELEAARGRSQLLQAQVEELQEEASLRGSGSGEGSLLSELEHSLDSERWGLDREQMAGEVLSILELLNSVVNPSEDRHHSDPERQLDSLHVMLAQIKEMAHSLAQRQSSQELNRASVPPTSNPCENDNLRRELQDQIARLQQENEELRRRMENVEREGVLQQAIRDRDEAISKKNAMESELIKSKNDMMLLNNQLLEAINRKLELSQELEAWQDDIQFIINQQLKSQQQSDQAQRRPAPATGIGRLAFLRRPSTPTLAPRRVSSVASLSPAPESPLRGRTEAPWREWLRRGRLGQPGH